MTGDVGWCWLLFSGTDTTAPAPLYHLHLCDPPPLPGVGTARGGYTLELCRTIRRPRVRRHISEPSPEAPRPMSSAITVSPVPAAPRQPPTRDLLRPPHPVTRDRPAGDAPPPPRSPVPGTEAPPLTDGHPNTVRMFTVSLEAGKRAPRLRQTRRGERDGMGTGVGAGHEDEMGMGWGGTVMGKRRGWG